MKHLFLSKTFPAAVAFISFFTLAQAQSLDLENQVNAIASLANSRPNNYGDSAGITDFNAVKTDILMANKFSNAIQLEWFSENEINTRSFEIERSSDGNNFKKMGRVATQNPIGKNHYSFLDEHPISINYYRLKIIDADGKFSYSKIVVINQKGSWYSAILPNPFVQSFTIQVYLPASEQLKIQLLDMSGRLIRYKSIAGVRGINKFEFNDIGSLQPGLYMVRVIRMDSVIEQKIIKSTR